MTTRRAPESAVDATANPAQATSAAGNVASVAAADAPRASARTMPRLPRRASQPHRRGAERAATSAGCRARSRSALARTNRNGARLQLPPTGSTTSPRAPAIVRASWASPCDATVSDSARSARVSRTGAPRARAVSASSPTQPANTTSVVPLVRSRTCNGRLRRALKSSSTKSSGGRSHATADACPARTAQAPAATVSAGRRSWRPRRKSAAAAAEKPAARRSPRAPIDATAAAQSGWHTTRTAQAPAAARAPSIPAQGESARRSARRAHAAMPRSRSRFSRRKHPPGRRGPATVVRPQPARERERRTRERSVAVREAVRLRGGPRSGRRARAHEGCEVVLEEARGGERREREGGRGEEQSDEARRAHVPPHAWMVCGSARRAARP
jgi:hypothetical protein